MITGIDVAAETPYSGFARSEPQFYKDTKKKIIQWKSIEYLVDRSRICDKIRQRVFMISICIYLIY
jgi:hypothetical protein